MESIKLKTLLKKGGEKIEFIKDISTTFIYSSNLLFAYISTRKQEKKEI